MNWLILEKNNFDELKKYKSVLVFCDSDDYPYDIVEYGILDDGEEFWHSYLHINANMYEYSSDQLTDLFTHYIPIINPAGQER